MSDPVKRRPGVGLFSCLVASVLLHLAAALPFIMHAFAEPPDEPSVLVVELQGAVSDVQTEQKILQETSGVTQQQTQTAAADAQSLRDHEVVEDPPANVEEPNRRQETAPPEAKSEAPTAAPGDSGANNVTGVAEKQAAQTIRTESPTEAELLREYAKLLSKKVHANLVSPGGGRASSATVSFFILSDGRIRPDSLRIVASSGQSRVDASALQTIRASVPFAPPPREMGVTIVVDFNRKG